MKNFNLLSIFTLFITLLCTQNIVAQTRVPDNESGTWYLVYDEAEHDLGVTINKSHLEQSIADYPAQAYFEAKRAYSAITDFRITFQCYVKSWENPKTIDAGRNTYNPSDWFNIPTNTTKIRIYRHGGSLRRYVKNIKVRIAPHTKLTDANLPTNGISFNTSVTNQDGETRDVSFYSFLTGSNGMTISIVDANGNPTTVDGQISLVGTTSYSANQLGKINEKSFKIKFKPNKIQTNANCSIKITNTGASINPEIIIPVTLNSTLATPENLKCDAFGYTFAQLSWNAVNRAESYNIYDKGIKVENNITFNGTSATITGLAYGSNHSYTITSVVGSAESNESNAIEVNCPAYPQVQNVHFTNVQQNQVTVEWNPVTISPANHSLVRYHVHFYENAAGAGPCIDAITTTGTSYTFTGLIDQTQYTAYVDVEYQYTLNGETKNIIEQRWSSNSVTTASFIPSTAFDGVERVQGEWYRIMSNSTKTLVEGTTLWGSTTGTYTITLNYPCNNLSYQAWLSDDANADHTISDDAIGESQNLSDGKIYTRPTQSIDTSKTQIVFTGTQGYLGSQTIYLDNIYAKIAPHIRLKPLETNTLETEIEAAKNLHRNVNFKSFLAMGNMTISSNNPQFLIDGYLESKTIECGANYLCKTDNTEHNFSVVYIPKSVGTHEATITITDGTSTEIIELIGICKKKTPTITWVANKQLVYGTNLANAASSDCGTAITYTSGNEEIIRIENNELVPVGLGTTTITATTAGNDKYESINSTAEFEVVNKDIQIVVWEQEFYLLKLTDDDIPLNAYTKDKETGEPNKLPIEYSSANTDIVTINDGALHIVGKGQTTITAYQQGNGQYAGTYMTKTVIVREVSNDCSGEYALVDDGETWDKSGFDWNAVTRTCELSTVGEYLTFTTTKTGGFLGTTRDKITVTDEHGVQFHSGGLGTTETVKINRNTRKLTFTLEGNLTIGISEILVTQATYLEAIDKTVSFQTQYGATGNTSIDFNWANQPDFIWAKIVDDANEVFSIADGTNITTATCGTYGTDFVNIKFKPTAAGNYTAKLVLGVGQSEEIKETIDITATAHKASQSIIWKTDNLTTADRQVQIAESDKNIDLLYEIINGTGAEVADNGNSISVIDANTFIVRAYNDGSTNYNPISAEKEFTSTIGTIKFDNSNGNNNWSNRANWLPVSTLNTQRNVEPSANVNAVISAEAVMSETNGEINNLTFENDGKLTIGATSGLKANAVNGATADNLTLKASANGNATLIYNSGTPSATVEMYSKATGAVNNGTPQWQYMGVAVNNATTSNFPNAWLLKWTEAESAVNGDPWSDAPLAAGTTLAPWAGYSISQPQATTYTMKGALMNGNHTYTLTRTESTDPDCGFNLLANSYTAPIDITKLTTSDFVNADACIILYNTGTYEQWESQQGTSGENPGQLTVIPIETVGATDLPKTIPSMQAFFVMAQKDGATFTVNYENAVANTDRHSNQMRAPRAENEFNVLKIMIEGENTRDRLYLLENEETSKAYDNGYEARKIFDAPRGHQMYATCEYGYASIDCSESFVGQTIGLKGDNEGEMLTISFDTDRLEGYESLYLYDKATGKYVNIVAGEKYTFFGVNGADDNRFSIVTNPDDKAQTPPFVVIGEELAFDKSQINTDNANIYIYDTSGRLLMTDKINPHENYNIPNMPKGIYLISMNGYTTKIVKK